MYTLIRFRGMKGGKWTKGEREDKKNTGGKEKRYCDLHTEERTAFVGYWQMIIVKG